VNLYATDPGRPTLRALLAERLRATLVTDCEADDIVITAGANHAFATVLATLVDAGDEVVLPAPYFTNHHMQIVAAGAVPVVVALADHDTHRLTWDDIEPALTPRTRAVVLCNPSNPTGAPITPSEGERIVRELAARDVVVVSDETYLHFVYDGPHWSAASVPGWRRNVVVVGTFSKSFGMMGWRVGFVVADAEVCEQATKVQDAMIICAPVISQLAVEGALADDWDHPLHYHDELVRRRRLVAERIGSIPGLDWTPTGGGFFAFVRVHGCADSYALAEQLIEEAFVVTIPGSAFGPPGEGHLRMSYGSVDADSLDAGLDRLGEFFGRGR
jgi:aminotransferase